MDGEIQEKKPRKFVQSEILRNYAGAIAILLGALPAVGSLIVSVVTAYRGEPVAEKTWTTVRTQLNQQAAAVNKLHLRVVHMQAHEEGKTSAAIQLKLDELQKKYDQLRVSSSSTPPPTIALPAPRSTDCKDGQIRINDRCRPVSRSIAAKVRADEKETDEIRQKLMVEKLRRMEEEERRRAAEKKVKSTQSTTLLRSLPKKLDDAAKGDH
jgi:hypothetical protein